MVIFQPKSPFKKNIAFMANSIIARSNPAERLFFLSKFVLLLIHSASLFQKALNVIQVDRCWPRKSARKLSWGEPNNRASFTATKCELALNRAGVNVTKVTLKRSFCVCGLCWDFTPCYCCSGYEREERKRRRREEKEKVTRAEIEPTAAAPSQPDRLGVSRII